MTSQSILVKSHISRDLLQNAALFKTDKLVIWEYVSNGLQYTDLGTNPTVYVKLDSRGHKIVIADNGRGMNLAGLQNFFIMHGENLDRKSGSPGRGRFGTGKSAAFGIADLLRISSVHGGKKSIVELSRADLDTASTGDPIPVRILMSEESCKDQNGTKIEIERIHLKSLDQPGIIRYIERQIARWPKNCTVFVNNHECEFSEPPIAEQRAFEPTGFLKEILGQIRLVLKVAKAPVDEDIRGVSIFSKGVWHETTLAGSEGKEMANYLLGEVDIPKLEDDTSPISPFDLSRSMRLNPNNEIVQAAITFIGQCVEQVRKELVDREKRRRQSQEALALAQQAAEIARYLNEDFGDFKDKVSRVKAKAAGLVDSETVPDSGEDSLLKLGGDQSGEVVQPTGMQGADGDSAAGGHDPRELFPELEQSATGKESGSPTKKGKRTNNQGGFRVEFKSMGRDELRALYVPDERTIYINLDHPQIAAAKAGSSVTEITFLRLAYEIAFTEYAIALASELGGRGEYSDWSDPIYDVRQTVNRLARKAAELYLN